MLNYFSSNCFRVALLAIIVSLIAFDSFGCAKEVQLSINEFSGTRYWASLWVDYERLPSTYDVQKAKDEAEFKKAWTDAGVAASKVVEAWNKAFEDDPLLKRAFECLNRYHDLQWQYSILRKGLRRKHGFDGFRSLEQQGRGWIETNGNPWLKLDDTRLLQLVLWWAEYVHSYRSTSTDTGRIVPYEWLTKPDDRLAHWTEVLISLSPADLRSEKVLAEDRAIELFRIGVKRKRRQVRKQHAELTAKLELPTALYQYLAIRQEAEAMHEYGYSYLQIEFPKLDEVARAEKEFHHAQETVSSLRPYALVALQSVHTEAKVDKIKILERREAERQAILSKDY